MTWGVESNVIERFWSGRHTGRPDFLRTGYLRIRCAIQSTEFVHIFRTYYGPTMNAFAAAEKNGKNGRTAAGTGRSFHSQNRSPVKGITSIPATFLLVTVNR